MALYEMTTHKTIRLFANTGHTRASQSGLSLVELMVAMVISLLLLAGVIQIFLGSKQSYTVNEGLSRLQENARFAFDRIGQDISASGYMGCNDSGDRDPDGNLYIHNALTINNTTKYDFSNPLDGTEGGGPGVSDTLSVRRAITASSVPLARQLDTAYSDIQLDNTHPNYAALEQWQTMAVTDCQRASVFMITNDPASSAGVIQHDPGIVSPAGKPNEGQSNAGTLFEGVVRNDLQAPGMGGKSSSEAMIIRVATNTYDIQMGESGAALFLNGTEFIEGVQEMQVLYGLDTDGTPGAERYVEANDAALSDMNQVASVQISLTMNTVDNVQIQGQPVSKTFTQTFRVRNR